MSLKTNSLLPLDIRTRGRFRPTEKKYIPIWKMWWWQLGFEIIYFNTFGSIYLVLVFSQLFYSLTRHNYFYKIHYYFHSGQFCLYSYSLNTINEIDKILLCILKLTFESKVLKFCENRRSKYFWEYMG